jgi:hypothetical protein
MNKKIIIAISFCIICISCITSGKVKDDDLKAYYKNVVDEGGLSLHATFLIILPVNVNDTLFNVITSTTDMVWYLREWHCKGRSKKARKKLLSCLVKNEPLELSDTIFDFIHIHKIIPSKRVDSLYHLGIDYFSKYFIDFEYNIMNEESTKGYSQEEVTYILSILFKEKYYLFVEDYGQLMIYRDYPI